MLQFFYVSKKVVNFEEIIVSNFVKGMIKKSKTEDMLVFLWIARNIFILSSEMIFL